ncbi:hypothetical protein JTE90_008552, partial [Oedothorax gibbosus]
PIPSTKEFTVTHSFGKESHDDSLQCGTLWPRTSKGIIRPAIALPLRLNATSPL